ncbi:MAG: LamG-like jellyroll fold domain-containing protein [Candidatus Thermoplasmatota archaeon]
MHVQTKKILIALSLTMLFFGFCFVPCTNTQFVSKNTAKAADVEHDEPCQHCGDVPKESKKETSLASEKTGDYANQPKSTRRRGAVFTDFHYVPESDNSDHITYTIDLGATYGDTIICHLLTEVTTTTIDLADNISFLIYSTPNSPTQIYERYTCGNKTVQDVGKLHDSIYIATLMAELGTLEITLNAQDSYPRLLFSGSYVEVQDSDPCQTWATEHGDWSVYPGIYTDLTISGYAVHPWVFAHGYHASWKEFTEMDEFLRSYSEVAAFSYREFSPIETAENRRANIFIRTTWAGSMDVNSVSPIGASLYGYIVGSGLAWGAPPPAGISKWTKLAEGGDLVDVLGPALSYTEEIVNIVANSVLDEAIEQSLGIPGVGNIIDILQFYDMLFNVSENTSGAKTIFLQNVKLNQNVANYIWAGAYIRAQAAGASTAYVNFRYDGDPFLEGGYENHHKGIWLHNALIYYAPVEYPIIEFEKPADEYTLIAQNDTISFTAKVTKGNGPYTYEWFEERRDEHRNITSRLLSVQTGVSSKTTWFSTNTLAPGRCTIVVKVTDKNGGTCTDYRSVEILAPPSKPTITVSQPSVQEYGFYLVSWNTVDRIAYYVLQESTNNVTWYNYPAQTWLWRPFLKTTPQITYYYRVVPYNKFDRYGPVSNVVSITIQAKPEDAPIIKDLPVRNGSGRVYGFHWKKTTSGIDYGYHLREYQWVNLTAADRPRIEKKLINEIYWNENTILNLNDHVMYQNQTDGSWWFGYSFSHTVTEPTVYEYQIACRRKIGSTYYDGNWSRNVSIEILPPPKYAPRLIQPTFNTSHCVPYFIEWTYNQSDIHEYFIEEATNPTFTQNLQTYTTNKSTFHKAFQHSPTTTTTYYYRVKGKNSGGFGPWSNPVIKKVYGTSGVPKPGTPSLKPSTRETYAGQSYSFTWNRIEPEGQYRLQEATDRGFDHLIVDKIFGGCGVIPATNWSTAHNTTFTRTYYYRIQALAPYAEDGDWSDTITVTVYGNKTQPAPLLHDPGTTIERYRAYIISWDPVSSTTNIDLQESTDPLFSTIVREWDVSGSRTDLYEKLWKAPAETTTYYYRMRVSDIIGGVSPWSNIVDIQVLYSNCYQVGWTPPQGRPTLNTPTNGSIVNSDLPLTINWTRVPGATFYIVEEAEYYPDNDFVPPRCQWERSSWQVFNGNGTEVIVNRQGDANKILCYRVIAGNYCGLTLPSTVSTVTLLKGYTPGAPTNDSEEFATIIDLFKNNPQEALLNQRLTSAVLADLMTTGAAQVVPMDRNGNPIGGDKGLRGLNGVALGTFGPTGRIVKIESSNTVVVYDANGNQVQQVSGLNIPTGVCIGDYNHDGSNDIAVAEYANGSVKILNSTGAILRTIHGLHDPMGVSIGDINNDGYVDLAVAEQRIGYVSIFNTTGHLLFRIPGLNQPQAVIIKDHNHDGYNDIAVTEKDGTIHMFFGIIDHHNGNNCEELYDPYQGQTFGSCLYRPLPEKSYSQFSDVGYKQLFVKLLQRGAAVGDFDNDGFDDILLITGSGTGTVLRVYNRFGAELSSLALSTMRDVAIGDFLPEQGNEVVVSRVNQVRIYGNQQSWNLLYTSPSITQTSGVYIGDFNNDHINELAITHQNMVTIYNTNYQPIKEYTGTGTLLTTAIDDFNNNGFNDLAVYEDLGGGAYQIKVYQQHNYPTRPEQPTPQHTAQNLPITTDLSWSCTDPDPGEILLYDLYFGTTPNPELLITGHPTSSYDLPLLSYDTTYYWRIVAHDSSGLTTSGPLWMFSTKPNTPPNLPSDPTPSSSASNISVFVNLTWTCNEIDTEDTLTYDVYFGSSPSQLIKIASQQTKQYYQTAGLEYSTTYTWMVVAHDTYGHTISGPIWSFTTEYMHAQGYWHLDEGTGSIAYDTSTYHNDGIITGATWTPGKIGSCLYFDGNDYITIPHNSSLDITQPFRVEAWIRTAATDNYLIIVDKLQYTTNGRGFTLYINGGVLRLSLYCGSYGTKDIWGSTILRDNQWHHVAGEWTGTHAHVYVDGKLDAPPASWIYPPASSQNPLGIGKRLSGHGGTLEFKGTIDEVRISTLKHAPTKPYNPTPSNNSNTIELNPLLQVTINDPDHDILHATWYTNTTGTWEPFAANYSSDTTSPVTIMQRPSAFSHYFTTYSWKVVVTDGIYETSSIFTFTTQADTTKPEITSITATPLLQVPNKSVNISCSAFDLSGIHMVNVHILPPVGPATNITMAQIPGTAQYYYNTTYQTQGIYSYTIWAQDNNGNTKTSTVYTFSIGYFINLNNFPMYQAIAPYHQMCGPACAQMTLNYMWWNQTQNPSEPPLIFSDQQWLYTAGHANNSDQTIPYIDTQGLWKLLQTYRPLPYTTYGYNFNKYSNTNQTYMLQQICTWINYTIGTYGGYKPGHPLHVPALVPAYGDYSNWMAIRGIHTNQPTYPLPTNLTIYGFWVNDPLPGGIGENSYKTITQWNTNYYQPLTSNDIYNGKYVALCEPPETRTDTTITLATTKTQFTAEQQQLIHRTQNKNTKTTEDLQKQIDQWITQAAITGITEELIPYDTEFADLFQKTTPGTPLFIKNLNGGNDYYLVPFNLPTKTQTYQRTQQTPTEQTVIVVIIDANDGSFKETSWTTTPMKYLPISQQEAQQILFNYCEEHGITPKKPTTMTFDLAYRNSSPYYPEWRITINDYELFFFINQEGIVKK